MEQTLTSGEAIEAASLAAATAPANNAPGLERMAVNATFWTVLDYGLGHCLRVVNSLVLTRLLVPSAFGEMGLVMTLIVGLSLLSDVGLEPSVIQNSKGDRPEFLNTAWTLQATRGVVLWLFAMILAVPAAAFYHDPNLLHVLPVLALTTVIIGFNSTGLLTLSRHMGLKRLFFIDTSTQIVSLLVTICWAYFHPSVWALVVGSLVSNLYRLGLSHMPFAVPGHRNRLALDRDSMKEILHFGKWIFIGTALFFFSSQADRLVLGRLVDLTTLGIYAIAFQISDVPRAVINAFSSRVGLPFASRLAHLPLPEFRARFLRYRMYVLLAGSFLLSVMAVWGSYIILLLYPLRYHGAMSMIPILALGLWHTLLYNTSSPALLARGVSTYNAGGNALYCAAMLIGIPVGFHYYGMFGALIAIAAGDLPLYVVTQIGAVRTGVKPLRQDLLMTLVFVGFLALNYAVRRSL